MARFTSVIEPLPLATTLPVVLSARVDTPVGAIAAVMLIFPEFVPFNAPIRSVPADTWFSSEEVSDRWSKSSVPKLITLLLDCGAMVTTPLAEVVPMVAPSASLFAVKEISLAAETLLSRVRVAPVEVIETEPAVEVMLALDPEDVVMFPEPERVMFPEA
jgi:hypothetical protein